MMLTDLEGQAGRARRRARKPGAPPVVLLVLSNEERPDATLAHAHGLARSLGAELHLVQWMPPLRQLCLMPGGAFDFLEARHRVERCVETCRSTLAWCESVLGESLPARRLRIRFGGLIDEVTRRTSELGASLLIVSPTTARLGSTTTRLAQLCSCPVLVARDVELPSVLVAATDLEDRDYRVLRRATELGAALRASVVAVHNVSCLSERPVASEASVNPAPQVPRRVIADLPTPLDLVVTTETDTVGAILDQAELRRSRMIVVGTRRRSGPPGSVPAAVIERSRCSVLVTALAPRAGRRL